MSVFEEDNAPNHLLVRFAEQTLKTQQHGLHVVHGAPFVLQDIQADAAGEIDVGVIDGGLEEDGRGRIWVR